MRARFPAVRSALLAALIAALGTAAGGSPPGADPPAHAARRTATKSCDASCRGLGIEKVMAGDEHCGLVPRERKDESLAAACGLADAHREELERRAKKKASGKCEAELGSPACGCRGELRRWENVYTHVLSQRCWAECGWAYLIECDRRAKPDAG